MGVAMLGLGAAGKTRLVWQWSKGQVVRVNPGPTAVKTVYQVARADRIVENRMVKPSYLIYDFGGQQPGQFLDEAFKVAFQALVVVVDHTSSHLGPVKIDHGRVDQQVGYVNGLVRGFLQSHTLSRYCQVVVLFVNKADIVAPTDQGTIQHTFADIVNVVRQSGKKVVVFYGSAEKGWEVMDALASLDSALLG